MTFGDSWMVVPSVGSTQSEAATLLRTGSGPDVLLAEHQTMGRGRFGRPWHSERGSSLTMSVLMHHYPDHPQPWLLGMALAVATAQVLRGKVRWPNDVYGKSGKLAGILAEVWPDADGRRCAVIGVGANLRPMAWPASIQAEAAEIPMEPLEVAQEILAAARRLPDPMRWEDLDHSWRELDTTPGKRYRLPTGEVVTAIGVGPSGALHAHDGQRQVTVYAADAYFG